MKTTTDERLTKIIEKLKGNGMRLTPQRLAVLKILVTDKTHPTTDEVYSLVKQDFPMTSLATIYKTIATLKNLGELVELRSDGQAVRYDGAAGKAHPHLVCSSCQAILDVEFPGWKKFSEKMQNSTGYKIRNYRMDIFGLCPNCQTTSLSV